MKPRTHETGGWTMQDWQDYSTHYESGRSFARAGKSFAVTYEASDPRQCGRFDGYFGFDDQSNVDVRNNRC